MGHWLCLNATIKAVDFSQQKVTLIFCGMSESAYVIGQKFGVAVIIAEKLKCSLYC